MRILLRILTLIIQIAILFIVFYVGEWIQQYFQIPIPGSVIGLIMMFLLLVSGIFQTRWIEKGASFMVGNLVLFFIPGIVGILNYFYLFKGKGLLLFVITIVSTLLVMISSGLVSQAVVKERNVRTGIVRERKLENE